MTLTDKLTGHGATDNFSHGKNAENTTTAAPAFEGGNSTSSYGTEDTQRKKGLGEKIKEKIGLDPKDGKDPKDVGYSNTSSTTGTSSGVGSSTSGYSNTNQSSDYSQGTSGYDETQRKKGLGEKAKEAVGLDPKYNDPKDAAYGGSNSYSSSSQSTAAGTTRRDSHEHLPLGQQHHTDKYEHREAAPIVAEHVHDRYENIDRTQEEELHDRTKVQQTVQPVRDEQTESLRRDQVDHGTEVHEHGQAGLDARTKAELAAKREGLAREYHSTHDERTTQASARPNVDVQERTNKVEEVVPVVEKDIYRPHETEHHKRVVNIHHEAPVIQGQTTNAPVSLREWESQGHSISGGGRTRAGSSSSSSSSDNEGTGRTGTTRRKKGLGEKVKEAVGLDPKDGRDPKDAGYSNTSSGVGSSTSGYSNTNQSSGYSQGTSGYDETQRKKGLGEKAKEAVGLDPKYNDPKDAGYSNSNQGTGVGSSGIGSTGSTFGGDRTGTGNYAESDPAGFNQSARR